MFRKVTFMLSGLLLALGTACGSSTSGATGTPTPTQTSPSPSPLASAKAVSYDPCVLMTMQEAEALAGVNFGAGKEEVANATKECIYGSQTVDVLTIGILQAPDQATAQAGKAQFEAALQSQAGNGLTVTQVQGIGDAADEIQGSFSQNGTTIAGSAIYVLKGLIVFFITDIAVNRAVPSGAALQSQASTVLGRL